MVWSVGSARGVLGGLHLLLFAPGSVCGISPSTDLRVAFSHLTLMVGKFALGRIKKHHWKHAFSSRFSTSAEGWWDPSAGFPCPLEHGVYAGWCTKSATWEFNICQSQKEIWFRGEEIYSLRFPGGSLIKNPPPNAGDVGLIPASGRSPGEENGNPLHCSCLGNPKDEKPGWLQSTGPQNVGHNRND